MKSNEEGPRYPVVVALKVSREMDNEIRRRAREDERPVSSYLRRALSRALHDDADASRR